MRFSISYVPAVRGGCDRMIAPRGGLSTIISGDGAKRASGRRSMTRCAGIGAKRKGGSGNRVRAVAIVKRSKRPKKGGLWL